MANIRNCLVYVFLAVSTKPAQSSVNKSDVAADVTSTASRDDGKQKRKHKKSGNVRECRQQQLNTAANKSTLLEKVSDCNEWTNVFWYVSLTRIQLKNGKLVFLPLLLSLIYNYNLTIILVLNI